MVVFLMYGGGLGHFVLAKKIAQILNIKNFVFITNNCEASLQASKEFIETEIKDYKKIKTIITDNLVINKKRYEKILEKCNDVEKILIKRIGIEKENFSDNFDKIFLIENFLKEKNKEKFLDISKAFEIKHHSKKYKDKVIVVHSALVEYNELKELIEKALKENKKEDIIVFTLNEIFLKGYKGIKIIVGELNPSKYYKHSKTIYTTSSFLMSQETSAFKKKTNYTAFERPFENMFLRKKYLSAMSHKLV